ncbi:flagellar filament capping protein FliD [Clostridium sp.]|uniref:flagellar filament capping protein FliD n=1 Tax=Clostridium sp. TaxID=1506 RepID=UPI003216CF3A
MRITGLATGMDIDTMVKDMMKPYRVKVDKVQQDSDIYAMKQQLYRDVLKDSQEFYNKYFDVLKKDSLLLSSNWESIKFTSSDDSLVTAKGMAGATAENFTVDVKAIATAASSTLKDVDLANASKIEIAVDVKGVRETFEISTAKADVSGTKTSKELVDELNVALKAKGSDVTAKYSEFSKGIVLESKSLGTGVTFDVVLKDSSGAKIFEKSPIGTNADVTITNSKGETFVHVGNNNTVNIDGIEFTFNGKTDGANPVKLNGKSDVTALKDKLVGFINDYNKLIEGINTKVLENRDKKYAPLTPEQRKEMSEDEIKLWEKKTKEGLLRKDRDLERLTNSLRSIMSPVMGELKKIGITPISNYSDKNGMLTIDESELTKVLENNAEGVKDLFIKAPSSDSSKDGGILHGFKDVLYEQTVTVNSSLIKKVGMEGSVTATTNEYTKIMDKKKAQIAEMEKQFTAKESALYIKYSRLETQMANLNNQSAYLMQQLGG